MLFKKCFSRNVACFLKYLGKRVSSRLLTNMEVWNGLQTLLIYLSCNVSNFILETALVIDLSWNILIQYFLEIVLLISWNRNISFQGQCMRTSQGVFRPISLKVIRQCHALPLFIVLNSKSAYLVNIDGTNSS